MTGEEKKNFSLRVSQASKTELIVIMYEIAVKYIEDAIKCEEEKEYTGYRDNLSMARRTVNSLMSSLDMSYEISHELRNIYVYMNNELVKANAKRDASVLPRLMEMLGTLREAFKEVAKEDTSGPVMANTEKVYAGLTYSKGSLNESTYTEPSRGFTV